MAITLNSNNSTVETQSTSLPAYADKERVAKINEMYDGQINAQKANLEGALNQNVSNYEANKGEIAKRYKAQRSAASTNYEINRRNFNEQATQNGLNTGAGSQANLSMMNAYQRNVGNMRASEASDIAKTDKSIADLKVQYQSDINSAIANNDYQRAAAMLDEYNASYSRAMEKAQNMAQYGDFSGYAGIYDDNTIKQMGDVWAIQNPLIAYSLGKINVQKYRQITGSYPPGYNANKGSHSSGGGGNLPTNPDDGTGGTDKEPEIGNLTGLSGVSQNYWAGVADYNSGSAPSGGYSGSNGVATHTSAAGNTHAGSGGSFKPASSRTTSNLDSLKAQWESLGLPVR